MKDEPDVSSLRLHPSSFRKRRFQPYPQYRDSGVAWLGRVPGIWSQRRLKFCALLVNQKTEASASDLPYVGMENVESQTGRLIGMNAQASADGLSNLFEAGDVLFGKLRPYLAMVFHATRDGLCSSELLVYRPMEIVSQFMLYYMLSDGFVKTVDASTYGAKMPRASSEFIGNLPILLPSFDEQRAIAAFLDRETGRIDELIAKKRRLIELLAEKRTALISHAVTKGLNPDAPMKDSGIDVLGCIPKHWHVVALKCALAMRITDGPHETPEFPSDGVPFLSAEAVKNDRLDFERKRGFISEKDHARFSKKYVPKRGDVFMVKSGATTGNVARVETDEVFNIWSPLAVLRPHRQRAITDFIFYFVKSRSFFSSVELAWSYGTQQNIGMGVISNLRIALPPLPEQNKLAAHLNEQSAGIDHLICKVRNAIGYLAEYRSALISAAVTGKIDVREVRT